MPGTRGGTQNTPNFKPRSGGAHSSVASAASGETIQIPQPQKDPDEIHVQFLASAFEKADTRTVRIRDDATWVVECESSLRSTIRNSQIRTHGGG